MRKPLIPLLIAVALFASALMLLSGCFPFGSRASQLTYEVNRDEKAMSETLDKVFDALDSGNAQALKALFAVTAFELNPELESQIDDFFIVYKGPLTIENLHIMPQSSQHIEAGKKRVELISGNGDIVITAGGVQYHVFMELCSIDEFDSNNVGIRVLEFATQDAFGSRYYCRYSEFNDGPGLYYQSSPDRRDDIRWIEDRPFKYTSFSRALTVDKLKAAVEKDDDFEAFVAAIGEPNCSWANFGYYYYELTDLADGQFAVCKINLDVRPPDSSGHIIKFKSIVAIYLADEDSHLETLWMADDIMRICGDYRYFVPANRELTEDFFTAFAARSTSLQQLTAEIGEPNAEESWFCYYQLSDNLFVSCKHQGDTIKEFTLVDADKTLHSL